MEAGYFLTLTELQSDFLAIIHVAVTIKINFTINVDELSFNTEWNVRQRVTAVRTSVNGLT